MVTIPLFLIGFVVYSIYLFCSKDKDEHKEGAMYIKLMIMLLILCVPTVIFGKLFGIVGVFVWIAIFLVGMIVYGIQNGFK